MQINTEKNYCLLHGRVMLGHFHFAVHYPVFTPIPSSFARFKPPLVITHNYIYLILV